MAKDELFETDESVDDFAFDDRVAAVFDDMVRRSVPMYEEVQRMVADLAANFAHPGATIYDLGCSTATTMIAVGEAIADPTVHMIGIDNAPSMLEKAKEKIDAAGLADRCELVCADLAGPIDLSGARVVMLNWTLQFIRPVDRDRLIRRIADSLEVGGALILTEKVTVGNSMLNRMYIERYYNFKQRNGYSDREIAKKREALENVLIPYRVDENMRLLRESGLSLVDIFFRWYNFSGFLAVKTPPRDAR